jgi:tRNA threonylcarbamoyladenosine biosynthesis protein TsaB
VKLLALESADKACSVALWLGSNGLGSNGLGSNGQDGEVLERFEIAPRQQTLLLLPWVEAILAEAGLSLSQLDAIAFGRGPGAFTGVRVATSVAQGLAFSSDLPVVGVSTLAALAHAINQQYPQAEGLLPVLDARMGEVYLGAYLRDDDGLVTAMADDRVCAPEAVRDLPDIAWQAGGSGLVYAETLATKLTFAGQDLALYPQAASVAALAARAFARGEAVAPENALPVYLRDKVTSAALNDVANSAQGTRG